MQNALLLDDWNFTKEPTQGIILVTFSNLTIISHGVYNDFIITPWHSGAKFVIRYNSGQIFDHVKTVCQNDKKQAS